MEIGHQDLSSCPLNVTLSASDPLRKPPKSITGIGESVVADENRRVLNDERASALGANLTIAFGFLIQYLLGGGLQ